MTISCFARTFYIFLHLSSNCSPIIIMALLCSSSPSLKYLPHFLFCLHFGLLSSCNSTLLHCRLRFYFLISPPPFLPFSSFLLSSLDLAYSCFVTLVPLSSSFSSFLFHCFFISLFLLLFLSLSIYLSICLCHNLSHTLLYSPSISLCHYLSHNLLSQAR